MSLSNESASNVNTNPKIDKRGGERRGHTICNEIDARIRVRVRINMWIRISIDERHLLIRLLIARTRVITSLRWLSILRLSIIFGVWGVIRAVVDVV